MVPRSLTALVLGSMLTACASQPVAHVIVPEQRITLNELRLVQVDCAHRHYQVAWLEQQMALPRTEPQNIPYEQDWANRAKQLMWQIRTVCG